MAIMLPNVPAFVIWYYGALRIGAIAVSISTRLAAPEVAFVISDCEAKALVGLSDSLTKIQDELPDCVHQCISTSEAGTVGNGAELTPGTTASSTWVETDPDEPALILYTSGTTGFAKGATLSHMNVRSNVHAIQSPVQHAERRPYLAGRAAVSLFWSKRAC